MQHYWQDILQNPIDSFLIIGNLILIESLLSVDNAAVLATMVMDLPQTQREKALRYGIWGAYILRGVAMLFASWLIKVWWLKPLGGIYLMYLTINWVISKKSPEKEDDSIVKSNKWLYKKTVGAIGNFWATVALVEFMDLAFSIDNVFAAVAFTPNLILIIIGVFIGILAMRFVAQGFVKLMRKYPFLETSAFVVIGVLGVKLTLSIIEHFYPTSKLSLIMQSSQTESALSIITVLIFFFPLIPHWIKTKQFNTKKTEKK